MDFNQWGPLAIQIPVVIAFMMHSRWTNDAFLSHLKVTGELDRAQRKEAMMTGLERINLLCVQIEKVVGNLGDVVESIRDHETGAQSRHATLVERLRERELGK